MAKNKAYKNYEGKYVYVIYRYDCESFTYIGQTINIKRRMGEHLRQSSKTGFAKKVPFELRRRDYKLEVFDFSAYEEVTRADLRLLESLITVNMGADASKPMKMTAKRLQRIEELKQILPEVTSKTWDELIKVKPRQTKRQKLMF